MKPRDRDTGRKWVSGAAKRRRRKKKRFAEEVQKIKFVTRSFSCISTTRKKISKQACSAIPYISVQVKLFEAPAQNLCDYSDCCLKESLVPSVSSTVDSKPEFNIEQQQALSDDIALVSDDPSSWPESFSEHKGIGLIIIGLTHIKKFVSSPD
jgi:hypothetical protein